MKEDVFYFWLRFVEGTDLHRGLLTIGRIDPEWLAAMFSALTFSACQDRNSDEPLNLASLIKFALLREDPLGQYFDPAHLNASLEAIQLPFSSIDDVPSSFGNELLGKMLDVSRDSFSFSDTAVKEVAEQIILNDEKRSVLFTGDSAYVFVGDAAVREISVVLHGPYEGKYDGLFAAIFSRFFPGKIVPLKDWTSEEKIDVWFALPPWGYRSDSVFDAQLKKWSRFINKKIYAFVVPNLLTRKTKDLARERQDWVKAYGLQRVITFPENSFHNTAISLSLLEFSQLIRESRSIDIIELPALPSKGAVKKTSKTELNDWENECINALDGNAKYGQKVPVEELEQNQWILNLFSYRETEEKKEFKRFIEGQPCLPIFRLADIVRSQSLSRFLDQSQLDTRLEGKNGKPAYEVKLKNIDADGNLAFGDEDKLEIDLADFDNRALRKQVLEVGDILVGTIGSVGKIGIVTSIPDGSVLVCGQSLSIVRIKEEYKTNSLRAYFLFLYLKNKIVQDYLVSLSNRGSQSKRAGIPSLPLDEFSNLPVIQPTDDMVETAFNTFKTIQDKIITIKILEGEKNDLLMNSI